MEKLKSSLYEVDARFARLTFQSERLEPSQQAEAAALRAEADQMYAAHVDIVFAMNELWTAEDKAATPQRVPEFGSGKFWTSHENVILAHGVLDGLTYADIATKLPGRAAVCSLAHSRMLRLPELRSQSLQAQKARLQELQGGYTPETRGENFHTHRWSTQEESTLLQAYRDGLAYNQIHDLLPGRSKRACVQRTLVLRIRDPSLKPRDSRKSGYMEE